MTTEEKRLLRNILELIAGEARAARKEALAFTHEGTELFRWEAFRLRHYAHSLEDIRALLKDRYNGF